MRETDRDQQLIDTAVIREANKLLHLEQGALLEGMAG